MHVSVDQGSLGDGGSDNGGTLDLIEGRKGRRSG